MVLPEAIVTGYLTEIWGQGRVDRAPLYIDDRYEMGELGRGPDAASTNVRRFRDAFPDLAVEVVDVIAQGSRVAVWMRMSGTHRGEFRGHPGTGRFAAWDEVGFFTVEGGRIVAGRFLADMFGLRKALGVVPPTLR